MLTPVQILVHVIHKSNECTTIYKSVNSCMSHMFKRPIPGRKSSSLETKNKGRATQVSLTYTCKTNLCVGLVHIGIKYV